MSNFDQQLETSVLQIAGAIGNVALAPRNIEKIRGVCQQFAKTLKLEIDARAAVACGELEDRVNLLQEEVAKLYEDHEDDAEEPLECS